MKGIKYKVEKQLVLKHDVILGSTYETQNVLVEQETPLSLLGGEAMYYDASVVITIGKPHRKGSSYTENELEELGSNNTNPNEFPIKINGHTIGDKEITTGKKGKAKGKDKA